VDDSGGANQGNIYVVYANNDNLDGADVAFQRSIDGGMNFSTPILLDSRPGSDRPQWFPWVTVDKDTGRVYVFYLDQGIADNGDLSETTYLYSEDGGITWTKPMPLTDRPFHAGWGNDTGQPNLGDYNQGMAQGSEFFVVWAGTEQKGFADPQPVGTFSTPDVFFKRAPAVKTSLDLRTVTFTESNGNGFIDAGDQVHLTMPLRNYVTNLLTAGSVTGISGTLSTTTPGVAVTAATSSYPDLAPGVSAPNTTDYILQLSPSFVNGTHIELALAVSSDQGTNALLFTQSTGTPGATVLLSENFDGVAPGSLPAGWATSHAGGSNTVPWTTNNMFFGTASNAAFHINANDATNPTRFERLFSPIFNIPANAEYIALEMDIAYDTEDDPSFNVLAYDGFLLRITDQTTGRVLISALAEAFEEELTTGSFQHYPKHFPRSSSTSYFQDMSAWSGDSVGFKHVHMKFPGAEGLAGARAQLRFEYTQDSSGICTNVRPTHTQCGVMFDNLVVQSFVSVTTANNGPICEGATLQLSASTVTGATYSWTGPNGFTSSLQNPSIPNATTAASGTYSVTLTVSGSTYSPVTNTTAVTVIADGASCNDGSACTLGDTCQSGTCTGTPVVCTAQDLCHAVGTCDPGTGMCSNPLAPDGTPCIDGDACTQGDMCDVGSCLAGSAVVCSPLDQRHLAGICDTVTGTCSNPEAANGTSCNDANACTQTDACQTGTCAGGNPIICMALDQCHVPGVCNPGSGLCSNPAAPNGTGCDDGNACTVGDICGAGTCQAGGLRDDDGDTHVASGCGGDDCDDTQGSVWDTPDEVPDLDFADSTTLAWPVPADLGGVAVLYDVIRSGDPADFVSSAVCVETNDGSDTTAVDLDTPTEGAALYYLVRPENSCPSGQGVLGRDSGGTPKPGRGCP